MLDSRELALFSHYLAHTSRTIPFDQTDAYALQIGFPNLAFGSKPLMSSILALAAACQCHDLLTEQEALAGHEIGRGGGGATTTTTTEQDALPRVRALLALAEQHHAASLRQVREAIPTTSRYDCILASAALMVLYGSATHCLRIRLVETYGGGGEEEKNGEALPVELLPMHSQWISLIRAVHFAYVGLVADAAGKNSVQGVGGLPIGAGGTAMTPIATSPGSGIIAASPGGQGGGGGDGDILEPQDGPSDHTRRLFLPIVATTSGHAMKKLRAKAQRVEETAGGGSTDLQACWDALARLEKTVEAVFAKSDEPCAAATPPEVVEEALPDVVAPWLRRYIARVTSNNNGTLRNPYRRTISSFLNRVPAAYVELVQTALDHMPPGGTWSQAFAGGGDIWTSAAQRLAVDIFAHWLVLEMLLDGVWWIRETGSWELGRAVAFMRGGGGLEEIDEDGEDAWWPGSMYKIRTELRRQAM